MSNNVFINSLLRTLARYLPKRVASTIAVSQNIFPILNVAANDGFDTS